MGASVDAVTATSGEPARIAIVGAGPRGLYAAEEILKQSRAHGVPVHVDVYDDQPLSCGAAYDPEQPPHRRINGRSAMVRTHLGAFDDWRRTHGETGELDPFPPRSLVGRFHRESWEALLAEAGDALRVVPVRVAALKLDEGRRCLELDDAPGTITPHYDEILLVTGHARSWPGELDHGDGVFGVYPGTPLDQVPAGATVAVRGAALTFVDACLDLTEGRDGVFRSADGMEGPGAPLIYEPSGREPKVIRPWSRTGRFMQVKSDLRGPLADIHLEDMDRFGAAIRNSANDDEFRRALAGAASALLDAALAAYDGPADVAEPTSPAARPLPAGSERDAAITAVFDGTDDEADDPAEALRHSLAVVTGQAPPDVRWAVGHAWLTLYQAIVWRTSAGRWKTVPGFEDLARTLERVAFGLIPSTAARILALIDAGIIDASTMTERDESADVTVDGVLAPAGRVDGTLADQCANWHDNPDNDWDDPLFTWETSENAATRVPGVSVAGRDADRFLPGADTLDRSLHQTIPRWAGRVVKHFAHTRGTGQPTRRAEATVPLTGRLEPWSRRLLADLGRCQALVDAHSSPVNVLRTAPMLRNAAELVDAGAAAGVEVRVFYARKANKAIAFVDAAREAGHGIDVASERELSQVLDRDVPSDRIILSAAVKPDRLLDLAVRGGVTISVDCVAELRRLARIADAAGVRAHIAPRLAADPSTLPPTRFGERRATWNSALPCRNDSPIDVVGVHVHLHGYSADDRRQALAEALAVADRARELGHRPEFIDLGGGVPMSYVDDAGQWSRFIDVRSRIAAGDPEVTGETVTWKDDPLPVIYPFHQSPVRGEWLRYLLHGDAHVPGNDDHPMTAAEALRSRGLRLHLEPGRSLLDGCGVTLARVVFLKHRSDGLPLVGLEMNRTQCRTTASDILVDPILVPAGRADGDAEQDSETTAWPPGAEGFLVGAYCIEDEVIVRRRQRFPEGIRVGDIVALPNTAGYFMHILESASHQIPLAVNVVDMTDVDVVKDSALTDDVDPATGVAVDLIDRRD